MNIDQKKWDDMMKRTDMFNDNSNTIKTGNNEIDLPSLAAGFANQVIPEIKKKLKVQIEKAEVFLSPKKGEIIQNEFQGDLFEKLVCDPAKQDYLKSETYKRS